VEAKLLAKILCKRTIEDNVLTGFLCLVADFTHPAVHNGFVTKIHTTLYPSMDEQPHEELYSRWRAAAPDELGSWMWWRRSGLEQTVQATKVEFPCTNAEWAPVHVSVVTETDQAGDFSQLSQFIACLWGKPRYQEIRRINSHLDCLRDRDRLVQ
jgi:hypothetical protein